MASSKSTARKRKQESTRKLESVAAAIEQQRLRLNQCMAMVSCLGYFLAEVPQVSRLPDCQPMADVIERMLETAYCELDPEGLGLPDTNTE